MMVLSPATAELLAALIPTVSKLVAGIVELATLLIDEGYEVPKIEELRKTNDALRALPDLDCKKR